jgi:hypothetical protein
MFWYLVKEWNVENKCDNCFVVWCGMGKFDFLLCFVEVLLLVWSLWLLVEFGVGKELVVEKCGVLSCIATRIGFHVIFVFPLKCNCFIFILWFKRFLCVLFVFILWNTNVVTNKLWVKSHYGGAKNVVILYYFIGVSMFELQPW